MSERQFDAVYLAEFTNKEIAALLDCEPATVKCHLRLAFSRLKVTTRTAAYKRLTDALAPKVVAMPQGEAVEIAETRRAVAA